MIKAAPSGVITSKDLVDYLNDVLQNNHIKTGTLEYIDMRNVTDIQVNYSTSHALVRLLQDWMECGWAGSYYYAPKDIHYGMIRMVAAVLLNQENDTLPGLSMLPSRDLIQPENIREFLLKH